MSKLPDKPSLLLLTGYFDQISLNPEVMSGRACIKDTRIPVYTLLQIIGQSGSFQAAVEAYERSNITEEQVKQALLFAAAVLETQ